MSIASLSLDTRALVSRLALDMASPERRTRVSLSPVPAWSGDDVAPPPLPPPRYLPGLPGINPVWGTTANEFLDWKHGASYPTDSNDGRRASRATPSRNASPTSPAAASAASFGSATSGASYPPREGGVKRKRVPDITFNSYWTRQTSPDTNTAGASPMAFSDSASVLGSSAERTYVASSRSSLGRLSDPEGSFTREGQDTGSDRGDLSVWCCYLHDESTGEPCRKTFQRHAQLSRHKRVCHPRRIPARRYSHLELPRETPTRRHRSRRDSSPRLSSPHLSSPNLSSPNLSSPRVSSPARLLDRLSAAREQFRRHIDARTVDNPIEEDPGG